MIGPAELEEISLELEATAFKGAPPAQIVHWGCSGNPLDSEAANASSGKAPEDIEIMSSAETD